MKHNRCFPTGHLRPGPPAQGLEDPLAILARCTLDLFQGRPTYIDSPLLYSELACSNRFEMFAARLQKPSATYQMQYMCKWWWPGQTWWCRFVVARPSIMLVLRNLRLRPKGQQAHHGQSSARVVAMVATCVFLKSDVVLMPLRS